MEQPFVFGIPADDPYFIGREKEIKRLEANFKYGINTVLMSPRRWGKTSLVNRVAGMSAAKGRIIVQMDIFACRSEYDFYNTFSSAILRQTASKIDEWKDLAKGFIERLTPKIGLSPDPGSDYYVSLRQRIQDAGRLSTDEWQKMEEALRPVYPDFATTLRSFRLSDVEYQVSLLLKLRIPLKDISTVMCKDATTISSIRSRLYQKVFQKKGGSRDWDDFIATL